MKRGKYLSPLSALYGAAIRTRLSAYSRGLLPVSRLPRPVISVGNITVGGTGKTPLVEWICRSLAEDGKKICILTRGYGRRQPKQRVVVSDGTELLANEADAGDEPFLLASQLLGTAAVISDSDRFAAGSWAVNNLQVDAFVLDDGFQYLQLARDLNVLVIDASNPWGGGNLLPTGNLREPVTAGARADCTVITRAESAANLQSLKNEINNLTSYRPLFTSRMRSKSLRPLSNNSLDIDLTQPIAAFSGVGNPESFFDLLTALGYSVVHKMSFRDHHRYTQSELDLLAKHSRTAGARVLVTTAKDAVKLGSLQIQLPCYELGIEIQLEDEQRFRTLLCRVTN